VAFYLNVFEQGNQKHAGLLEAAMQFFGLVRSGIDLREIVNDSRNVVFGNFFFARPSFWALWRQVFDRLFEIAENQPSPLRDLLRRPIEYRTMGQDKTKPIELKVFVAERIVSFLLATQGGLTVRNYSTFRMPFSDKVKPREIVTLDALKIAYAETGDPHFITLFHIFRQQLVRGGGFLDQAVAVK
jgi:hypothetical protein